MSGERRHAERRNERPKMRLILPPSRRAAVLTLLMALAMGVGAAVAQVWTHQRVIELGYEISRQTQQQDRLQERHRRLQIELEILKSPRRIGRIAASQFGMRPAEPEQIRRLPAMRRKDIPVVGSLERQRKPPIGHASFGGRP